MKVAVYNQKKKKVEDLELQDELFAGEVNIPLLHQVVTAQTAGTRSGTASTKTRKDVRGSTAKPFRQKGTGRARQGSVKSPLLRGGGVIFGPHPRSFKQKINKKMFKVALRSALTDRIKSDALFVVDGINFSEIKTKNVSLLLKDFNISNCLIVDVDNTKLFLSARNIYGVETLRPEEINPYDVLRYENLMLTKAALEKIIGRL